MDFLQQDLFIAERFPDLILSFLALGDIRCYFQPDNASVYPLNSPVLYVIIYTILYYTFSIRNQHVIK